MSIRKTTDADGNSVLIVTPLLPTSYSIAKSVVKINPNGGAGDPDKATMKKEVVKVVEPPSQTLLEQLNQVADIEAELEQRTRNTPAPTPSAPGEPGANEPLPEEPGPEEPGPEEPGPGEPGPGEPGPGEPGPGEPGPGKPKQRKRRFNSQMRKINTKLYDPDPDPDPDPGPGSRPDPDPVRAVERRRKAALGIAKVEFELGVSGGVDQLDPGVEAEAAREAMRRGEAEKAAFHYMRHGLANTLSASRKMQAIRAKEKVGAGPGGKVAQGFVYGMTTLLTDAMRGVNVMLPEFETYRKTAEAMLKQATGARNWTPAEADAFFKHPHWVPLPAEIRERLFAVIRTEVGTNKSADNPSGVTGRGRVDFVSQAGLDRIQFPKDKLIQVANAGDRFAANALSLTEADKQRPEVQQAINAGRVAASVMAVGGAGLVLGALADAGRTGNRAVAALIKGGATGAFAKSTLSYGRGSLSKQMGTAAGKHLKSKSGSFSGSKFIDQVGMKVLAEGYEGAINDMAEGIERLINPQDLNPD